MNLKDLFTIISAYIRGFWKVRIFKIDTNLYQSGHLHGEKSLEALRHYKILHIVDLEGGIDEIASEMVWYRYWPIYDGDLPDLIELWKVAKEVQDMTTLGNNVLVHCQGGCNRASLVNGCVLYLRGYRGRAIVKKIRVGRPGALTNHVFKNYLSSLG